MTPRARWWWRGKVAAAAALTALGLDAPVLDAALVPVALAVVVGGTAWLVRLLVRPAPGETEAPLRRKQVALSVAVSVALLVALVAVGTAVRMRPERLERRAWRPGAPMVDQMLDPELGWAPFAPPDVVGQRLQRVDPRRPRVLLLGDSVMYSYGVRDEDEVGRPLEALLPGWQVLNGSVSGYSVDQYVLMARRVLPVVRPRVLVVGLFGGNDYQVTTREFSWGNHKPLLEVRGGRLVRADVAGPCTDRLSRSLLFRLLWLDRDLAARTIRSACRPRVLGWTAVERTLGAAFDEIDALAARHGARVLYVMLPVMGEFQVYDGRRYLYLSRHRDLWRLLGARPRERYEFGADLFRGGRDARERYQPDHGHLTAEGYRFLAGCLRRELDARGMLR